MEIYVAHVWVRLSHLPIIFWDESTLKDIGDKTGRYIDRVEPKINICSCARICVKINLEKGLLEAVWGA
jgi:hypothetical protein